MLRPKSAIARLSAVSLRRYGGGEEDEEDAEVKRVEIALLVFRCAVVLTMLAVALNYVARDVIAYYRYDTITAVSVDLLPNVTFPAVTLCNYNRWKNSTISSTDKTSLKAVMQAEESMNLPPVESDYLNFYTDGASEMPTTEIFLSNSSTVSPTLSSTTSAAAYSTNSTPTSGTTPQAPSSNFNLYNFTRYSGWKLTDPVVINKTANTVKDGTLLSCSFRGVSCDTNFFTKIVTSYGNCYTFNKDINWPNVSASAKRRLSSPLVQTVAHEDTGLSIEVDIETWDYYENVDINGNYQLGLKVIVHSPDRLPNPSAEGISVSPGYHATIPVTWSEYNYMEPPWGACNASASLQSFTTYTQEGCMWECIKTKVRSSCSCIIYYQANDTDIVCDLNQSKDCAYSLIGEIGNNPDTYCTCPVACKEESYDSAAYYSIYPSPSMAPGLAAQYGMTPSYYSSNVVSVDIFLQDMSRTTVTQVPAMSLDQVLADAGGQLGLFAGASVVTLVELIEFFFERWAAKREEKAKINKVHPIQAK